MLIARSRVRMTSLSAVGLSIYIQRCLFDVTYVTRLTGCTNVILSVSLLFILIPITSFGTFISCLACERQLLLSLTECDLSQYFELIRLQSSSLDNC